MRFRANCMFLCLVSFNRIEWKCICGGLLCFQLMISHGWISLKPTRVNPIVEHLINLVLMQLKTLMSLEQFLFFLLQLVANSISVTSTFVFN